MDKNYYTCSAQGCKHRAYSSGELKRHFSDKHGMPLSQSPVILGTCMLKEKRPSAEELQKRMEMERSDNLLRELNK